MAFATRELCGAAQVVGIVHLESEAGRRLGAQEGDSPIDVRESAAHVGPRYAPGLAGVSVLHLGDAAGSLFGQQGLHPVCGKNVHDRETQVWVVAVGEQVVEVGDRAVRDVARDRGSRADTARRNERRAKGVMGLLSVDAQ